MFLLRTEKENKIEKKLEDMFIRFDSSKKPKIVDENYVFDFFLKQLYESAKIKKRIIK